VQTISDDSSTGIHLLEYIRPLPFLAAGRFFFIPMISRSLLSGQDNQPDCTDTKSRSEKITARTCLSGKNHYMKYKKERRPILLISPRFFLTPCRCRPITMLKIQILLQHFLLTPRFV
jgi:hypothetical protein